MEIGLFITYWYALMFGAAMYCQRRWVHDWEILASLQYGVAMFFAQLILASIIIMIFNT